MDRFYRRMRQQTGILMKGAKPIGGKFSFDWDNRNPWRGDPPVPQMPAFEPDEITREVIEFVDSAYATHFGSTAGFNLPVTQRDCELMLQHVL